MPMRSKAAENVRVIMEDLQIELNGSPNWQRAEPPEDVGTAGKSDLGSAIAVFFKRWDHW
jgi:uncharacterized protein YaiE (UPF0345 family)